MKYKDKLVWITGASSGIGEALTYKLNSEGAKLIISSRRASSLEAVKNNCTYPEQIKIVPLDLEKYTEIRALVAPILEDLNQIDYLINNSGISQRSFVKDTNLAVDEKIMKVNFLGTIALTKAILPQMLQQKAGKIVTISSMVGKYGTPRRSSYAASKHALHGYMDALRAEVFEDGIQVQIICPGYVKTKISINAVTADGSAHNQMDPSTEKGIPVDEFARKVAEVMLKNKDEVNIAGPKELFGLYLKRFAPALFNKVIRKISVT